RTIWSSAAAGSTGGSTRLQRDRRRQTGHNSVPLLRRTSVAWRSWKKPGLFLSVGIHHGDRRDVLRGDPGEGFAFPGEVSRGPLPLAGDAWPPGELSLSARRRPVLLCDPQRVG